MKKVLAILLAACMVVALFACGGKTDPTPSADPTPTAATTPGGEEKPTPGPTTDGVPLGKILEGDHAGREKYKIVYMCNTLAWAWNAAIADTLGKLGEPLNYEFTAWAANNDFDAYLNNIPAFANQGYQGFVLGIDDTLAQASMEACLEAGVSFVAESTTIMDKDGLCIWSSVQQAQVKNGGIAVQWLYDHWKDYWTDATLDGQKVGLIGLNYSAVSGINERKPGVEQKFAELFPDGKFFDGDLAALGTTGFSAEGGNQLSTQIYSQNPDIEKWFVVAYVDDWAIGATRAAEQQNITDKTLVVSIQADAFLAEMSNNYTGNVYVAACAVSSTEFAIDMANYLVATISGVATPETIWPEWNDAGGSYPRIQVEGTMITRDTYKDYLAKQAAMLP
ncbi:MAG: hypothetical protein LBO63_05240 [Oscillospiraceae bacterium]|jgi:hypothetical protein|nr:hypothetical protein [Oscillospiraceae bacterium]